MNKIENEFQVEITNKWIKAFKESLTILEEEGDTEGIPVKHKLHVDATKSMIADLEEQLRVYYEETRWVDARFGEHWIENTLRDNNIKNVAEVAFKNGRARVRLEYAMKKIVELLNPNDPKQFEARDIAVSALYLDKKQ